MNYIVNPSWFYWLQVINGLNVAFEIIAGVAVFAAVVLAVLALVNYFTGKIIEIVLMNLESQRIPIGCHFCP